MRTTSCVKLAVSVIIQMVHIVRSVLQVRPRLSSVIWELVFLVLSVEEDKLVDVVGSETRTEFQPYQEDITL